MVLDKNSEDGLQTIWQNDVVSFDGYVAGEWHSFGYPYDSITLLYDTFLNIPDGIYDQYIIYGDDPFEYTLHRDTLILPRNLSYGYDYYGNNGYSEGYVGYALLYAPPSPGDTTWIDSYGDTCRIPRVWAHQWWGWESSPSNDEEWYDLMIGKTPATSYYRFVPPLNTLNECWGLQTSGPFTIADKDTLRFVWVAAVGQKMNGGNDRIFKRGWIKGLRQVWDLPHKLEEIKIIFPTILFSSWKIFLKEKIPIEIIDITGRRIRKYVAIGRTSPFKGLKGGVYILKLGKERYKIIVLK